MLTGREVGDDPKSRATGVAVGVMLCAGERGAWMLYHGKAVPALRANGNLAEYLNGELHYRTMGDLQLTRVQLVSWLSRY